MGHRNIAGQFGSHVQVRTAIGNSEKHIECKNPILIVQIEPPQTANGGDYYYRTHAPGIAMAREDGVYVINTTSEHRRRGEMMARADVLILKNICDPDILPLINNRKKSGKLTVYEIADDLNALQPWNQVYSFYKKKENLELVYLLASASDALQTTCSELKRLYGHLNNNCEIFPNHILHGPYERPLKNDAEIVIGWGGSHGHLEDMKEIAGPLNEWLIKQPNVSLHLMCSGPIWKLFDSLPDNKKRRTLPGTIDDYYCFLQNIDIGIAPIKDTAFNRSRSDVKFLEYAISGVVPVMSKLGPYSDSVNVNRTGFLFNDSFELVDILNRLIKAPSLIRKIAKESQLYVLRERQQLQHGRDRIIFYKSLLGESRSLNGQNNGGIEFFKKLSKLDGAVRNKRHLQLLSTRFENLLHDGLLAMQVTCNKELAYRLFKEAMMLGPENYLPFLFGASVTPDPVNSLLKAIKLNPDSLKAWILLGEEFEKRGKVIEALESYESAAGIYPEYNIPYLRASKLLNLMGENLQSGWLLKKAKEMSAPFAFA